MSTVPTTVTARWLPAHAQRLVGVASTGSARPAVSSLRSRRAEEMANPVAIRASREKLTAKEGVGDRGALLEGQELLEVRRVLEELLGVPADGAVDGAEQEQADGPAHQGPPLEAHGQAERGAEPPTGLGRAGALGHQAAAEVAPGQQHGGQGHEGGGGGRAQPERPPALVGEGAHGLGPADGRQPRQGAVADVARRPQHEGGAQAGRGQAHRAPGRRDHLGR